MSDIPVRNVQRETFNSPTFNGVTERAHGGLDMGTGTNIWATGLLTRWTCQRRSDGPSRLRRPDMGTDTMSDIPVRNVQRETFNSPTFNGATERAHGRRDMGTDTKFVRPDSWPGWTCPSAGRTVQAGCGTRIWGQTRCPMCRTGTFNVKRSTLNF
jgi:hypothetical protein